MASLSFEDLYYHRQSSSGEAEYLTSSGDRLMLTSSRNSLERNKYEAEVEIMKHIRLTDYYQ